MLVISTSGMDALRRELTVAGLKIAKAANSAIAMAGPVVFATALRDSTRRGVSLRQLERMDHPYARRHGGIQAGALGGSVVARPWMVHERDGRFRNALSGTYRPSLLYPVFDVELDGSIHLVRWIVQGTRVMLPRDVLGHVAEDPVMRAKVVAVVSSVLKRELS